jgi:putative transposase
MSRPPRVELAGGVYHVIARGNERRDVFRDDADRRLYLARLAQCSDRYEFGVLAYCLMPNHVHLAIERGPIPLSKIMLALHSYYSQKFNFRYGRVGHLFQGRYKAFLVEQDRYLDALVRYIHYNPVKAGLVDRAQVYRWSSDQFYRFGHQPQWLDVDRVLRRFAPTPARAAAAYRRWMVPGNGDDEAYADASAIGRVIKGDEKFAESAMRAARVRTRSKRRWTAGALARTASKLLGFSIERLRQRDRSHPESRARLIVAYIGRRDYAFSTTAMAGCFGREESSFAHGLRRLEDALEHDRSLSNLVERIAAALRAEKSELQVRPQESGMQG